VDPAGVSTLTSFSGESATASINQDGSPAGQVTVIQTPMACSNSAETSSAPRRRLVFPISGWRGLADVERLSATRSSNPT
jgi:hypothetical protein